jgi:hypothetical protein
LLRSESGQRNVLNSTREKTGLEDTEKQAYGEETAKVLDYSMESHDNTPSRNEDSQVD